MATTTPPAPTTRRPLPLNLALLHLTPEKIKFLRPVTTLDIFDGRGGNFHEDGLFSTATFGNVGDPVRDRRFGYVDCRLPVLHPLIYTTLCKLDRLYKGILHSTDYATYNPKTNDFESADVLTGETGLAFFLRHFDTLSPRRTGSSIRDVRVDKILKYKTESLARYWPILPAGLREIDFDSDGRISMDEVNELYQGVLIQVRNLPEGMSPTASGIEAYDRTRLSITLKLVEVYQYIETLLSGKRGFIQGRFASRRIFNSTRNVLTSMDVTIADLTKPNHPAFRSVMIGLNQATKNVLPKAMYYLKTSIVEEVFDTATNEVRLVDPKTLELTTVEVSHAERDTWTTMEGLERVINDLGVLEKRGAPVMVAGHYLALIYVDPKAPVYRVFRNIHDLPEHLDRRHVRPITLMELIYLSGVDHWNTFPAFVTRYPVENMHSSVPCRQYVKTTQVGELRYRLNANWEKEIDQGVALEFPVYGKRSTYFDSVSVPVTILGALGAD